MKKKNKVAAVAVSIALAVLFSLLMLWPSASLSQTKAPPKGEPIVIGYVGQVASPGTKPCMDIQQMAVDEINAAGGILGRPVKYIVQDGKGDTSLSVEAARKLIIEDKATFVSVEGRSEICLAVQENSGNLFKEYPHILVFNGPMGSELTARIIDEAPKYDFCFRDWDPEPAHYAQTKYIMEKTWKKDLGVKKIAILWEDLAWTTEWRKGIDYINLPTWEKLAESVGLKVVYSKAVKPRGTMYMPILQEIANKKADLIFFVSSWFTDTDAFAKQWADSAAKDIYVSLYGGVAQTRAFWSMTGGKALGIFSSFTDLDVPVTSKTLPLMEKAIKRNIPMQIHVHIAYADIYHFKAAIEAAGGTNDIKKLIKAMEEVETEYSLGKVKYETQKVKPFYHSRVRVNPKDPWKTIPGYYYQLLIQFQEGGKIVYLNESCPENEKAMAKFINPKAVKTPAQLRKIQARGR
ncbi:MAG TPA: ABC transporter substrate-binding protein [Smithellaceae bacterium]|mgnify:FL=1|nr:ABC transporter substrate-binding protein [Smithellaceae bacterium]HQB92807.1 ABC transporter substrate-binding protein [Smithellaceae bacterium]